WRPYIETCVEAFGPARCMFESNFPPDRKTCDYGILWNAFKRVASQYSATEQTALFSGTAATVYRLGEVGGGPDMLRRCEIGFALRPLMAAVLLAAACNAAAAADEPEFYRGKQITLAVGSTPGSAYDFFARIVARVMGRHIPGNPVLVV